MCHEVPADVPDACHERSEYVKSAYYQTASKLLEPGGMDNVSLLWVEAAKHFTLAVDATTQVNPQQLVWQEIGFWPLPPPPSESSLCMFEAALTLGNSDC